MAAEKEGRVFGGWWRGWMAGSPEQVGAMSLFIFILLLVKKLASIMYQFLKVDTKNINILYGISWN